MKIILLLSLLVLCTSKNYACLDSTMIMDEKICKYETNDTIYLRACPYGEIWKRRPEGGDSSLTYCQSLNLLKFHDESCNLNTECYTNNCVKNKCTGKADGESCDKDYECGKESYCEGYKCTKYATKNGDFSELECPFGYKCVDTGNGLLKCIEYFSVKVGEIADDYILCESNVMMDNKCYDERMKNGKEFQECEYFSDCVTEVLDGEGNVVKESTTSCKIRGPNGWVCAPTSSSKQWKNFVKGVKEVRDNISKYKAHQSLFMDWDLKSGVIYNSVMREKLLDLYTYKQDDCILDNLVVLAGSGFIKVSLIALLLFIIIA